ncbi:hypothetical protein TELCIR_07581, partial [Teladorsagia circumcincta]
MIAHRPLTRPTPTNIRQGSVVEVAASLSTRENRQKTYVQWIHYRFIAQDEVYTFFALAKSEDDDHDPCVTDTKKPNKGCQENVEEEMRSEAPNE